jgi:PilZ domain
MELTSNKKLTTIEREQRLTPRFHLLTRVDIAVAGGGDTYLGSMAVAGGGDIYWGSMLNLSRTGMALVLRHQLKPKQRVAVRFHFQSLDGREVIEELIAKANWQCGDNTGLEFETPLTAGSPALQKARFLVTHLEAKEAGR